jgi:hypothetical protein
MSVTAQHQTAHVQRGVFLGGRAGRGWQVGLSGRVSKTRAQSGVAIHPKLFLSGALSAPFEGMPR